VEVQHLAGLYNSLVLKLRLVGLVEHLSLAVVDWGKLFDFLD